MQFRLRCCSLCGCHSRVQQPPGPPQHPADQRGPEWALLNGVGHGRGPQAEFQGQAHPTGVHHIHGRHHEGAERAPALGLQALAGGCALVQHLSRRCLCDQRSSTVKENTGYFRSFLADLANSRVSSIANMKHNCIMISCFALS